MAVSFSLQMANGKRQEKKRQQKGERQRGNGFPSFARAWQRSLNSRSHGTWSPRRH